jgi:hypothetical protein
MKHTRKESTGTTRHMLLLPVFLVAVVALILGATSPVSWAFGGHGHGEVELDEAEVFIEYNSTDGDFGIHFFWDGEPWKWMTVWNEHLWPVLNVSIRENVRAQGLTEAFFESAEPTLRELSFQEFLDRFPEDEYRFRGRTLDWKRLVGEADFTHVIPCPLDPEEDEIRVNWDPDTPTLSVEWDEVETVVNTDEPIGLPPALPECTDAPDLDIVGYEVVFELVIVLGEGEDEEEQVFKETTTLPAGARMLTASPEFTRLAARAINADVVEEFKGEIIAREASGNQTITEFDLVEED